jgi:hypothetical protein
MMSSTEKTVLSDRVAKDSVEFRGHPLVRSTHPTTIEITTEDHLSENGDCIIGVSAMKGCAQLDSRIKDGLRRSDARVTIRIVAGNMVHIVNARGDPGLELSHPHDIVIRKSSFLSDRTLAVGSDSASKDIPREFVRLLRDPKTVGRLEIEVALW